MAQIVVFYRLLLDVDRVPVVVADVAGLRGEGGLGRRAGTITTGGSEHAGEPASN